MNGYTILGAGSPDRVITVRVKNALALAKGQSALASLASIVPGAGPDFVEGQAYEAIANKIGESLAEQKAVAEVKVIDGAGIIPRPQVYFSAPPRAVAPTAPGEPESEIWKVAKTYKWGVVAGVGLSGFTALIWWFFRSKP